MISSLVRFGLAAGLAWVAHLAHATSAAAQDAAAVDAQVKRLEGFIAGTPQAGIARALAEGFPDEYATFRARMREIAAVGGNMGPPLGQAFEALQNTVRQRYSPLSRRVPAAEREKQLAYMLRTFETVKASSPADCAFVASAGPEEGARFDRFMATDNPIRAMRIDGIELRYRMLAAARGNPVEAGELTAADNEAVMRAFQAAGKSLGHDQKTVMAVIERTSPKEPSGAPLCDLGAALFKSLSTLPADVRYRFLSTIVP